MTTSEEIPLRGGRARLKMAMAWLQKTEQESDEQIVKHMKDVRRDFLSRLDGVSEAQANFSPGEGEWSISEVTRHMTHSNTGLGRLIPILASGKPLDDEPVPGIVPESAGSVEADRKAFEASMDVLESAIESLRNDPNLEAQYKHPWFGKFNARQWYIFGVMHQRVHIEQIDRIKKAEGYPAA